MNASHSDIRPFIPLLLVALILFGPLALLALIYVAGREAQTQEGRAKAG